MGSLNFTDTHFFAAATSCKQRMEHWFDFKSHLVRQTMRRRDCYINAGVYAMDLSRYRQARGPPGGLAVDSRVSKAP